MSYVYDHIFVFIGDNFTYYMENYANSVDEQRTQIKNKIKEQFFVYELRHHYNLRQPNAEKPTMVFLVVRICNEQVKISTGMKVYPKHWQGNRAKEGGCIPYLESHNNRLLNERLNIIDTRFKEYKNLINDGTLTINKESLRYYIKTGNIMSGKKQESRNLDIAKVLLEYLYQDTRIKDSTKSNYLRFVKTFGEYLSGCTIRDYSDITQDVMKGYQRWCIENTKGKNSERASGQSINHKVECTYKCIKRYLVNNGLMKGSQFADIQIEPIKEVYIDDEIALMDDELTMLYNYECENLRDEQIRDLFLLECTTSQRFSDIDKVDDLVEHKDGRTYFNLVQDKGGTKVEVDVYFQMTQDILEKYDYKLPTVNKKVFNKRIKEIAKSAGVTGKVEQRFQEADIAGISTVFRERHECISSHTGRRTFVTMLALRGESYADIARYTGHKSLVMVMRYDKSKDGMKIKKMFETLKKTRPEYVLKTVKECEKSNTQIDSVTQTLIQHIEQKAIENERLKEKHDNAQEQVSHLKGCYEMEHIRRQVINSRLNDLNEMLQYGFSYKEIKEFNEERDEINSILDSQNDFD